MDETHRSFTMYDPATSTKERAAPSFAAALAALACLWIPAGLSGEPLIADHRAVDRLEHLPESARQDASLLRVILNDLRSTGEH